MEFTEERELVARAVLDGQISADHLTDYEVQELELRVMEFVMQREMENAVDRGCMVFLDSEYDRVH